MKVQDIIFFLVLGLLIYKNKPKLLVLAGIIALVISIPLFSFWVFFTAERLTWYAGAFFLIAIIFSMIKLRKNDE